MSLPRICVVWRSIGDCCRCPSWGQASVVHLLRNRYPEVDNVYANFHAPFLVDQILSICAYEEMPPKMTPDIMDRAWANLFVDES